MSDDVRSEPSRTGTRCPPPRKVHYPESNGLPIAETRFQYDSLTYAAGALDIYFQDRPDVAVEGFRLLYYVEGDPRSRVAPDVFVVFGAPKRRRRTYLLWEEPKGPDFVLEVTSKITRWIDRGFKRDLYARLGVSEYWLFDPTGDWLDPRLQGNRLVGGTYEPLAPIGVEAGERVLRSALLGLDVYIDDGEIRFREPATGRKLLTLEETHLALRESIRARKEAIRARKEIIRSGKKTLRAWKEVECVREEDVRAREMAERAIRQAQDGIAELEAQLEDPPAAPPAARRP